jgi:hypothetical protein
VIQFAQDLSLRFEMTDYLACHFERLARNLSSLYSAILSNCTTTQRPHGTNHDSMRRALKKPIGRGTVSNELSLLRRMLRVAEREGFKVIVPSFEKLIVGRARGGRELARSEQEAALTSYSPWMRRLAAFAVETCLSEGVCCDSPKA